MTSLTAHGICNAIGGQLVSGPFERVASGGVCTDSRALAPHARLLCPGRRKIRREPGSLGGLPHRGGRRRQPRGARHRPLRAVILVEDTLAALQKLAPGGCSNLKLTVVGLTGSNGKPPRRT